MISTELLIEAFGRNVWLARSQSAGLSHADSLLQPPFRGNCLNWVLGHIANNRDSVLQALGAEPALGRAGDRYRRESDPIRGDEEGVLQLEEILSIIDVSQERIATSLLGATEAGLSREVQVGKRSIKVADRVFFLYFHETYHIGQAELLRQLAGANDHII